MRYTTAAAFRQALETRIANESTASGTSISRLRKRVAFELFLRRLVEVAPDGWVLKGALALDFRLKVATRATKDIDLGRDDDEDSAVEHIIAAQQLHLDDYFAFVAIRTAALDNAEDFTALRFNVTAELAGRIFERFVLDIGFGDPRALEPDIIETSDLLSFADIERVRVPTISLPQHLAEKVHAYAGRYGTGDRRSTRPKDLVDILLIGGSEFIDGAALRDALERTFSVRRRHSLPERLPEPPNEWEAPFTRLASEVAVETKLVPAFELAAVFLDPVLRGEAVGVWNPQAAEWRETTRSR
jgi:hypothetical protein